ncbi:Uncharacterised protein [Amycolatopsis camponoti]|uniref:Uncharacterized protein n=1 Tax=Amycolatopsis camponoti TaxID=2606593 RepID=A0A6I8LCS5_9PSEU|nr:Uncharacterised protein [Amycolatopsis camponoti]
MVTGCRRGPVPGVLAVLRIPQRRVGRGATSTGGASPPDVTRPRAGGPEPLVRGRAGTPGWAARGRGPPVVFPGDRAGELTPSEAPADRPRRRLSRGPHARAVATR